MSASSRSIALALCLRATLATADPPPHVLALGDSFTIGTGSRPDQSFPARLAARWASHGCAVSLRNLGVNGYTTQDLLDVELPQIGSDPTELATLAIGANDLVRGIQPVAYRAQLRRIFAALSAAHIPASRVVALPQPDWSRSPAAADFGDPDAIQQRIVAFNTILREEALHAGARYIDLWPLMRRQADAHRIAGDGLHPSSDAYDGWAEALARELTPPCTHP